MRAGGSPAPPAGPPPGRGAAQPPAGPRPGRRHRCASRSRPRPWQPRARPAAAPGTGQARPPPGPVLRTAPAALPHVHGSPRRAPPPRRGRPLLLAHNEAAGDRRSPSQWAARALRRRRHARHCGYRGRAALRGRGLRRCPGRFKPAPAAPAAVTAASGRPATEQSCASCSQPDSEWEPRKPAKSCVPAGLISPLPKGPRLKAKLALSSGLNWCLETDWFRAV